MPVNTPCADYSEHAPSWEIVRDCINGELAVKAAGEAYLPTLYKQAKEEYEAYKLRASFYNGTARTYQAWHGLITRKPPTIDAPETLDAFVQDCTLTGQPLTAYADAVIASILKASRSLTLIDWSETSARPYLTHYTAEQVINWTTQSIDGKPTLTLLVLQEQTTEPQPEDEFAPATVEQWRVFDLDTTITPPAVRMRIFRRHPDKDEEFIITEEKKPERRGTALQRIPAIFHSSNPASRYTGTPPPLLDIALLNLAHYRDSADLRNGLHVAGTPTPWAAGFTDSDDTELLLGVSSAWVSSDPTAKCGFLEFTGAGLDSVAKDMQALENQMAALGARAMLPQKAEAEAFQTVALRSSSETANLSAIAASASRSLTEVLQWAAFWQASAAIATPEEIDDVALAYNTDLNAGTANPEMINALVQAFQSGVLSWETVFHNFARAELYTDGRTLEEEQASIERANIAPPVATPPGKQPPAA